MMNIKNIFLTFLFWGPVHILCAQVFTDTLYSIADGYIQYHYEDSFFTYIEHSGTMAVGDGGDPWGSALYSRGYFAISLDSLKDNEIEKIVLELYQQNSAGNGIPGTYPAFWVKPYHPPMIIDHILYGNHPISGDSLFWKDWTAGNEGDPNTLSSNIGVVTDDSVKGWKRLTVTQYVLADIAAERNSSRFRLRLTMSHDDDRLADNIGIATLETKYSSNSVPRLIFYYKNTTAINDINHIPSKSTLYQNYPNPFNPVTNISFSLSGPKTVFLSVFDLSGRLVKILIQGEKINGKVTIQWDGSNDIGSVVSSGIYIYTLKTPKQSISKKMLFLK